MNRIILIGLAGVAVAAAIILAARHDKPAPVPAQEVAAPAEPVPAQTIVETQALPKATVAHVEPMSVVPASYAPARTNDGFADAIDFLISTNSSFHERQKLLDKLIQDKKIAEAIKELQNRADEDPSSAQTRALIGEAMLKSIQTNSDIRTKGIMALGADRYFDEALNIEPDNWEAGFYKAVSLSHWPADLNKGEEVVQRFNALIELQEKSDSRPQFSRTYISYGDYYQRAGNMDAANEVWQRGFTLFPSDSGLKQRLNKQ